MKISVLVFPDLFGIYLSLFKNNCKVEWKFEFCTNHRKKQAYQTLIKNNRLVDKILKTNKKKLTCFCKLDSQHLLQNNLHVYEGHQLMHHTMIHIPKNIPYQMLPFQMVYQQNVMVLIHFGIIERFSVKKFEKKFVFLGNDLVLNKFLLFQPFCWMRRALQYLLLTW